MYLRQSQRESLCVTISYWCDLGHVSHFASQLKQLQTSLLQMPHFGCDYTRYNFRAGRMRKCPATALLEATWKISLLGPLFFEWCSGPQTLWILFVASLYALLQPPYAVHIPRMYLCLCLNCNKCPHLFPAAKVLLGPESPAQVTFTR